MPYHLTWAVPKRVLFSTFYGKISAKDLEQLVDELTYEIANGTPLVHHIGNHLEIEKIEFSLRTLQLVLKAVPRANEFGWQVDINNMSITRLMTALANQFANTHSRTVASVEEAIHFLEEVDPSLKNVVWNIPDATQIQK